MQILPGTPYNNPKLSDEMIALLNKQYGLDKPVWQQYLSYLWNVLHGDFGTSYQSVNQPVGRMIAQRLGISVQLGIQALIVGLVGGIIVGGISASHKNDKIDATLSVLATLAISMPSFIIGLFLLDYFGFKWNLLPLSGWGTFAQSVLPTLALGLPTLATVSRFFRSEMIETLNSDYIQLARSKGLNGRQVAIKHAYRNSMIPVLTLIGTTTAALLNAYALIEEILSIPGIGHLYVTAHPAKDYPVIMGTTIVYAAMLMVAILVTDVITSIVDPRVRLQ